MNKPRVLVVGSFVMDLIVSAGRFPQSGETVLGDGYRTAPGGKGANQAVQLARLGADVTMIGKVGQDAFGQELLASAQNAGIDVSHVAVSATAPSAVGNVQLEVVDGKSVNRIIVVSGANMEITPEDVACLEDTIGQYDMVVLQFEIPMAINCIVAEYAARKGVPVMVNCAPYAEIPPELMKNITYLSPNEHEAALLTGRELRSDADIEWALHRIREMGAKNALITLGDRGVAYLGEDGRMLLKPALRNLNVQDPTAAGDSFVGAFCAGVCAGLPIGDALTFANYTAGLTVCRMGAQPSLPTADEVFSLMESRGEAAAASIIQQIRGAYQASPLNDFIRIQQEEVERTLSAMKAEMYTAAAQLIWDAQAAGGRVHITGIGKPAHVANYIASLWSSTGTPTYFLHGTEAVHGSCGQLAAGDVVLCISNSGETAEMKATALAIRNNGCKIIAVTGNEKSWLAQFADAHLLAHVEQEGGPLNRAPRASILSEILVLQGLSIILQEKRKITPQEYVLRHPGGSLGKLRENEIKG